MFREKLITSSEDLSQCLFLGADIHQNNHTFVALDSLQQEVGQCLTTDSGEDLKRLRDWIEQLKVEFKSRKVILGLEDSNGNGEKLSRFLSTCGYVMFAINPVLTAQRRRRTVHQDKSDRGDALLIAQTLISEMKELPLIRVTEQIQKARALKGIGDDHDSLVKSQTQAKNQLHRLLYQEYGAQYRRMFKSAFSQKALEYWLKDSSNQKERDYASLDPGNPELTVEPSQIKNIRKLRIRQKVEQLMFLNKQLKGLRKIMEQLFLSLPYHNLLTLDGCGILLASRIVGEIKDIDNFASSSKLAKYSGLAPREHSSGRFKKQRRSKFGNRHLNKAFYRIALSQIGACSNPKAVAYYHRKIQEGMSKKRALKSLIRRNVDIVYAMMRDKTEYDPDYLKS